MTAPSMMTLQLPGFQSVRSETGVFGKRHVKVPFGAETAAETSAAGVEGGAAAACQRSGR